MEEAIKNYRTPQAIIDRLRPIRTVILTGITGAGKDTIIADILQQSDDFVKVITSTTRTPRSNNGVMERDGIDYYFLTPKQVEEKIRQGAYIEVASVHERINGSLVAEYERIAAMDKVALTAIDYQGAMRFLSFDMDHLSVYFVTPPNFEVYTARLLKRQGGVIGDREEVLRRFRSAQTELQHALDHPEFVPIMNDSSGETALKIIMHSQDNTSPSEAEQHQAREAIQKLQQSIADYIGQL